MGTVAEHRRIKEGDGDPRHGTRNGYCNHMCRCTPCRQASLEYERTRRAPEWSDRFVEQLMGPSERLIRRDPLARPWVPKTAPILPDHELLALRRAVGLVA